MSPACADFTIAGGPRWTEKAFCQRERFKSIWKPSKNYAACVWCPDQRRAHRLQSSPYCKTISRWLGPDRPSKNTALEMFWPSCKVANSANRMSDFANGTDLQLGPPSCEGLMKTRNSTIVTALFGSTSDPVVLLSNAPTLQGSMRKTPNAAY